MTVAEKLTALRGEMAKEGVDAVIVGNADPHNNELVAARWRGREWLSGLRGSNGTVVCTADWCGLWADSRYYEALDLAVADTEIIAMRSSDVDTPTIDTWLKTNLPEGATVAFFGGDTTVTQARSWIDSLEPAGFKVRTEPDLLERIWTDRPAAPQGELYPVRDELAGETIQSKLARVRQEMATKKIDAYLLGRTDESCWLFNFRGTDQPGNATPYCHTLVEREKVTFFIDPTKLGVAGKERYEAAGVTLRGYEEVGAALRDLPGSTRILLVPGYTNHALAQAAAHCVAIKDRAIVTDLKGVKNETEVAHTRRALLDDGAALVRFFHWLEGAMAAGETITEFSAGKKLDGFRAEVTGWRHAGFDSIVGFGPNSASNHYNAREESSATLAPGSLLLVDSGGNYEHGLTDTTRTISLGPPTAQQKEDYTMVLAALIECITLEFPEGATGAQIDGVCRRPLWLSGRNFKHGTGHGVGFGLEIHEGPQNLSPASQEKFILGQITTIEPGCYRSGDYGIRIENMVHTVLSRETAFGRFFKFENLTFCPINTDLVEPSLLTESQRTWLNAYHAEVLEKLTPLLGDAEREWLARECRAV